jgi:SAM-dependent methyltransferase
VDEDLIQRLYSAIVAVEEATANLAPYAPTPPELIEVVVDLVALLLGVLNDDKQPVIVEAGCGDGRVARALASKLLGHVVCVEIARDLCLKARQFELPSLDVVEADLRYLPLARPADVAYAYLLPDGVAESIRANVSRILISLDYYAPKHRPTAYTVYSYHYIYVYVLDPSVDEDTVARLLNNLPELINSTDNPNT